MDLKSIKNTLIYNEFGDKKAGEWFLYTRDKFISHVDTFYYSVKTVGEWSAHMGAGQLIRYLQITKKEAEKQKTEMPFREEDFSNELVVKPYFGFGMYRYGITKEDCFDIFIAENVPNRETNTIVVQLRSQFLWLHGLRDAFYESLLYLYSILEPYGLVVGDITENRIDFAYHTNYIQDMLSFFKDESLGKMQVSSYKRWSKEGNFFGDEMHNDYISLGRRKSNSSFVRIYNKSKEVVEMGYKQFFVPIWLESGLISPFDKYVFDSIFNEGKQSWNYKEVVRCRFYLAYGADEEIKSQITAMLGTPDVAVDDYKKLADLCVPDLTNVINLEIQTKRKFYHDFIFPKIEYPVPTEPIDPRVETWMPLCERRMYKILHMLQSIREYITTDTIRFVRFKGEFGEMRRERRPTAGWWLRLAACGELDGISYDVCRDYQKKYDVQRCKSRSLTSIATLASLLEAFDFGAISEDDISLAGDMLDVVSSLNDNDIQRYASVREKKRREFKIKFD